MTGELSLANNVTQNLMQSVARLEQAFETMDHRLFGNGQPGEIANLHRGLLETEKQMRQSLENAITDQRESLETSLAEHRKIGADQAAAVAQSVKELTARLDSLTTKMNEWQTTMKALGIIGTGILFIFELIKPVLQELLKGALTK